LRGGFALFAATFLSRLLAVSSRIPVARLGVICPKVCFSSVRLDLVLKIDDNTLSANQLLSGRLRYCLLVHGGKPGKRQHRMVIDIPDTLVVTGCRGIVEQRFPHNLRFEPVAQFAKDLFGGAELVRPRVFRNIIEDRLFRNLHKGPRVWAGLSGACGVCHCDSSFSRKHTA
jgi:hypothetical protein